MLVVKAVMLVWIALVCCLLIRYAIVSPLLILVPKNVVTDAASGDITIVLNTIHENEPRQRWVKGFRRNCGI